MDGKTYKLTPKQEHFARKYIELGNASEAYRQSYNASKMTDKSIWELACVELAKTKVASRVYELQEKLAEKHEITVEDLIKELEEARELARDLEHSSTMVSATMGKSKMLGFDTQNVNVRGKIEVVTGIVAAPNTDK